MAATDKLTATGVRAAKPRERQYKMADGRGLYLLVKPNGSRLWRLKYRHLGKEKTLALGKLPDVTLAEARTARDAARKLIAEGKDPMAEKQAAKRQMARSTATTFEAVAREWHAKQGDRWSERQAGKVLMWLERDVFTAIGNRPIAELTDAGELLDLVFRPIEKRGALDIVRRVHRYVSKIFEFAVVTQRIPSNPIRDLDPAVAFQARKVQHRTALPESEVPEFLAKLEDYAGDPQTRMGLKLAMLTFVRTGELRGARWAEIDTDQKLWRIPGERMKGGDAPDHIVPLSRQALEVIEALREITGHRDLLFPSQTNANKPMSENTMLYALYRLGFHSRATVHGMRGLASTTLHESDLFESAWIERQLAHTDRDKTRAAYNAAKHLAQRARMMQWWADWIDAKAEGREMGNTFPQDVVSIVR